MFDFKPVVLSPASRVANHGSVVWLRTGVSSGNRPMFGTKKYRKYRFHSGGSLRGQSTSRSAALEWRGKAWGSQRSPSRKDKCPFGPGSRGEEDRLAGSLGLLCASVYGLFL